jgi:hypothetical protein
VKGPLAVAAFCVALGLTVFFVTRSSPPRRGLSAGELAWVHRYSGWWAGELDTMFRAYGASTGSVELAQLRRPFDALSRCRSSLAADAGPAPKGLRDVVDTSERACGRAAAAVADLRANPTLPHPRRTQNVVLAINTLREADSRLLDHLVLLRPLESRSGPGADSRSDELYSRVATEVSSYNIDVRCWSTADWRQIRREAQAIGPETAKRFFASAGAFEGVANLAPSTCATLDRLAYRKHVPAGGAERRRLVTALATLGREAARGSATPTDAEAQCYGLQRVRPVARGLGVSGREAAALAAEGWTLYRAGRLGVRSEECRDGGAFDLSASKVWP